MGLPVALASTSVVGVVSELSSVLHLFTFPKVMRAFRTWKRGISVRAAQGQLSVGGVPLKERYLREPSWNFCLTIACHRDDVSRTEVSTSTA